VVVRTLRVTEVYIRHVRLLSASEESERWTNVTGIGGFKSTRQRQRHHKFTIRRHNYRDRLSTVVAVGLIISFSCKATTILLSFIEYYR